MKLMYFQFMFLLIFFLIIIIPKAKSDEFSLKGYYCTNTSTYDPKSTYNSSINTLLHSLASNATSNSVGYYQTTVGNTTANTVHGYYLCRGDLDRSSCQACMSTVITDLPTTTAKPFCPASKRTTVYYDKCMFRYSNEQLFQQLSLGVDYYAERDNMTGLPPGSDFVGLLGSSLKDLASKAANNESGKKYAVTGMYISDLKPLFALAQCTPDLSVGDCHECLIACIGRFKGNKEGETMFHPSCNIRYDTYPFFNGAGDLLSSSSGTVSNKGKRNVSIGTIIGIAAAIAVIVIALITIAICVIMKRKNQRTTLIQQHVAGDEDLTVESLQYDLTSLQLATNDFSNGNKLGKGGFGVVYKAFK